MGNQGRPFPVGVVLDSIGQIGRSTKPAGEAIGHKGIGFKSVLEVSATPELYSGLHEASPALAVRFDAGAALPAIQECSPDRTTHLVEARDIHQPAAAIRVLRFPQWVTELPACRLRAGGGRFPDRRAATLDRGG